ncbi:MAG: outer membrane lipoprotein-sorting protein [Pseudomonadota bacterium]
MKTKWGWAAILFLGMMCFSAFAVYGEVMDGLVLAQRVYERDAGKDSQAEARMLLVDKSGEKRFRTLITYTKDYGKTSKIFIRFTSPANIEGTSFLTWENEEREDDQFLYLPALQRVRRVVSSQKSNRFVNTDFTYEDLQSRKVEADDHKILRDEMWNGHDCRVLESIPKEGSETQYGKRISWIVKDIYLPVKTEFYDKDSALIKVFSAKEIKQVDGIWTVMESEMEDLDRNHRTLMKTTDIRYNTDIPDRVFTEGYMAHKE